MGAPRCPLQSPAQQALPTSPWTAALPGQPTAPLSHLPATLPVTHWQQEGGEEVTGSHGHSYLCPAPLVLHPGIQPDTKGLVLGQQPAPSCTFHAGKSPPLSRSACLCGTGQDRACMGQKAGTEARGTGPLLAGSPGMPGSGLEGRRGGEGDSRRGALQGACGECH